VRFPQCPLSAGVVIAEPRIFDPFAGSSACAHTCPKRGAIGATTNCENQNLVIGRSKSSAAMCRSPTASSRRSSPRGRWVYERPAMGRTARPTSRRSAPTMPAIATSTSCCSEQPRSRRYAQRRETLRLSPARAIDIVESSRSPAALDARDAVGKPQLGPSCRGY